MGKTDNNRYDTNKEYKETDKRREKRIKNPISTGSKRSRDRDLLRKVTDRLTSTKNYKDADFDDFDDLED